MMNDTVRLDAIEVAHDLVFSNRRTLGITVRPDGAIQVIERLMARNSICGAIEGRPMPEYSAAKSRSIAANVSSVSARTARRGWSGRSRPLMPT